MKKQKDRYQNDGFKEKAAEYCLKNRGVLKENENNKFRNLSEKEKEAKKEYQRNRPGNMKEKNKSKEYQAAKILIFCIV